MPSNTIKRTRSKVRGGHAGDPAGANNNNAVANNNVNSNNCDELETKIGTLTDKVNELETKIGTLTDKVNELINGLQNVRLNFNVSTIT